MAPRRAPLSMVVLVACTTALAACGGSSSSPDARASGDGQFAQFRRCLADHGVQLPDRRPPSTSTPSGTPPSGAAPPGGGRLRADPKLREASQACAKYRPQGAGQGRFGNGQGPNARVFAGYLRCLEDKGLQVQTSQGLRALGSLNRSDPKVAAALDACQSKLPRPGASPPTTTTAAGQT